MTRTGFEPNGRNGSSNGGTPASPPPGARLALALRETEASLRSFVDNAVFGIYRSSVEGRLEFVNRTLAAMLGYGSPDELVGRDLAATLYCDPTERPRLVGRFAGQDRYAAVETVWKRRDGRPIPVRLSGRVLRYATGGVSGFEGIVEDLSERDALEQRLRQAQKMEAVGQLAGGMAHDFNDLLTTILAATELIAADLPADSPARADLGTIASASRRGIDLIRQLLAGSETILVA